MKRTKIGIMTDVSQAYPWQDFETRTRHLYIVGTSGAGKSTFLLNLIRQECEHGMIIVDPDGNFANDAAYIIDKKGQEIVYVSSERPIVINPLDKDMPFGRLANEFIEAMNAVVSATTTSPESTVLMGEIILEAIRFLRPKSIDVMAKFLNFKKIRDQYDGIKSDDYWSHFDDLNAKGWPENREKVDSSKRIGARLSAMWRNEESARFTLGPNQFDPKSIAEKKQKVIFDFSHLDATTIVYLGNMILHAIKSYYKHEATRESPPLYIFIDEFHLLHLQKLEIILTQCRKYNISISLAHQIHRLTDPVLLHAIMGCCSTMAVFSCGPEEKRKTAEFIDVSPQSIGKLPPYYFYYWVQGKTQLLRTYNINGGKYDPGKTAEIVNEKPSVLENIPIIEESAINYYRPGWIVL